MKVYAILKSLIETADIHSGRLQMAISHLEILSPITKEILENYSDSNNGYLDMAVLRFIKLQGLISTKIFPNLLEAMHIDSTSLTVIDILNILEKYGFLEDKSLWLELRETRNSIAHEYPEYSELRVVAINKMLEQTDILLDYWDFLRVKIVREIGGI